MSARLKKLDLLPDGETQLKVKHPLKKKGCLTLDKQGKNNECFFKQFIFVILEPNNGSSGIAPLLFRKT
jgi:hypothetical protein